MACTSQHHLLLDHNEFGKTTLHQVARLGKAKHLCIDKPDLSLLSGHRKEEKDLHYGINADRKKLA
jgi:hypothetical protein